MTLAPEFERNSEPQLMKPEEYHSLLLNLLSRGQGLGKTQNVGAFLLPDIEIETLTSAGERETLNAVNVTFKKEPAYLLLDINQYPLPVQRELVVKDMTAGWGRKIIRESELPALSKPGIWINKKSAVEFDYVPVDSDDHQNSVRKPNVEAYRVGLDMIDPVKIPVQWDGGFFVASGGTVAIRERDVPALAAALKSIETGEASIEEALYSKSGVAKFDVYGMEPGFANGPKRQYEVVELKAETKEVGATFKQDAAPSIFGDLKV